MQKRKECGLDGIVGKDRRHLERKRRREEEVT